MSAFTLLFARNRKPDAQILIRNEPSRPAALREKHPRKAKSRQPLFAERKALRRHRGPQVATDQRWLFSPAPRSCIRVQSQEDELKRTKIVLALPSYDRQRLSGIRRGWCPAIPEYEGCWGIRSDVGDAHRLSLSEGLCISGE